MGNDRINDENVLRRADAIYDDIFCWLKIYCVASRFEDLVKVA